MVVGTMLLSQSLDCCVYPNKQMPAIMPPFCVARLRLHGSAAYDLDPACCLDPLLLLPACVLREEATRSVDTAVSADLARHSYFYVL